MSPLAQAQWTAQIQQAQEQHRYAGNSTIFSVRRGLPSRVSPELTRVVEYESDAWLVGALEELRALKAAGANIRALGDFRIAEETMDHVRRLLTAGPLQQLDKPQLVPFSGGGISLVWNLNNQELTFSVYPGDEQLTFATGAINDGEQDDGVVGPNDSRELTSIITRFLSNAAR